MIQRLGRIRAIAVRVLLQLRRDHRFLAISLMVPVILSYILKVFFDSAESPLIDVTTFVVPMGAFVIHFLTYILTAIVLVRERSTGTLSRMFVSGYASLDIIAGYLLAYTILASVQSLIVLTALRFLFDLDYAFSQFASIYLVTWLLAVISMSLGILVSNFARNEGQVFPFIPLVILPSILLSGLVISVDKLADWAQPLSLITPLYYANEVIRDLIKTNGALSDNWSALGGLMIYGLAVISIATLTLREPD
jgi:ABC-2 type transport system permease protein